MQPRQPDADNVIGNISIGDKTVGEDEQNQSEKTISNAGQNLPVVHIRLDD